MDLIHLPLLLLLPPLMLVSALCSASETALFSLTFSDRLRLRKSSPGAARAAAALLHRPRALLLSILLLTNVSNAAYFVVSSVIALARTPGRSGVAESLLSLAFAAASVLSMILLGDLLPKLLARRLRVEFCRVAARPLLAGFRAVAPVQRVLEHAVIVPLSRLVRPRAWSGRSVSTEELSALLEHSAREGTIDAGEQRLLEDVVQLATVRVREAMRPRVDVPFVDTRADTEQVREVVRRTGRWLLPLRQGRHRGPVVGWLNAKQYLAAWAASPETPVRPSDFVRPMLFVPESARLDQLLDVFRRRHRYAALCVDELGAVVGLIEIDDVLRHLIGPGPESGDGPGADVVAAGAGRWVVPGRLPVRDLTDVLDPTGVGAITVRGRPIGPRVSTVGGLLLLALGRVARTGDAVRFGNVTLRVESMRGRAVDRVLIALDTPAAGPGGVAGGAA